MIGKAVKNRIYVTVKKKEIGIFEQIGFLKLKKKSDKIITGKDEECMLFNKSKYKTEEGFAKKPDLILIDGGRGQLTQGIKVSKELDIQIPMVALAKKNEDVFAPGNSVPLKMEKNSDGLYLLQQIRDEAHRFALSYHLKLRSKSIRENH